MKSIALWLLFSGVAFCGPPQPLKSIPDDPTQIVLPGGNPLTVMHFSHYTTARRPVASVLNFIENARDDLLTKMHQRHEDLHDDVPDGSFVYGDENTIRFELHATETIAVMHYGFVEDFLDGLKIWARRWNQGPLDVPGTDIDVEFHELISLASGTLRYGLNAALVLPIRNASLHHI